MFSTTLRHAFPMLLFLSIWSSPIRAGEVRFIVFGDTQLHNPAQFERMVHEAHLLRPHFVAHTGDMIVGYTDDKEQLRTEWRRFLKQIEPLTVPFHPVPGNHDVGTPEAHRVYAEIWGDDRYYYSYDYGPVHCIVLNSYHDELKDRLSGEQIAWLEADLESYAKRYGGLGSDALEARSIFVFVHSPFWRYTPPHDGIADWERVHQILRRYPVRMVIGGQTDRDHEYVWERRDGIDYVLISSSAPIPQENERAGYFHGMLLYGLYFVAAGLLLGSAVNLVVDVFPRPVMGAVLLVEALALMALARDVASQRRDFLLMLIVAVLALSAPQGFLVGMLAGIALDAADRRWKVLGR